MPEEGQDVCMPVFCFMKEYFFSCLAITLLSQFSVNGSATEIFRVILNYRPKLIIVAKSKSWRWFNFCRQKTIAWWETSLKKNMNTPQRQL